MLGLLVQNQSHRAGTHLRGKLLRRIAHQTFFSGEMVSANPGAVHYVNPSYHYTHSYYRSDGTYVHGYSQQTLMAPSSTITLPWGTSIPGLGNLAGYGPTRPRRLITRRERFRSRPLRLLHREPRLNPSPS